MDDGAHALLHRPPAPGRDRVRRPGQVEQVGALGVVELQRLR